MLQRVAAVLAIAMIVFGMSGCSAVGDALTPGPKVVKREAVVAKPDAKVTGDIKPGLPDDVPLWPGARVTFSEATTGAYNLTLVATGKYADVLAGMGAGFQDAGWEVTEEDASEGDVRSAILTATGPSAQGMVTVTQMDEGKVGLAYVLAANE